MGNFLSGLFGGGEDAPQINVDIPEFREDEYILKGNQALFPKGQEWLSGDFGFDMPEYGASPYYGESQEALFGLSKGLLTGKAPEAYRSLMQSGGDEYSEMMRGVKRDVTTGVQEDLAKRGVTRGGIGTSAISKAMGEVSGKYGYEDYLRTQENKAALLGLGTEAMSGVRSAGLTESGQRNVFGLDVAGKTMTGMGMGADVLSGVREAGLDLSRIRSSADLGSAQLSANIQGQNIQLQQAQEASENQMWSDLLQAGIGAVGTIAGGPIGGMLASGIGNMFSGGGNTLDKDVWKKSIAQPGTLG